MDFKRKSGFWGLICIQSVVLAFIISCAGNTMMLREMDKAAMGKAEILGTVQGSLERRTQALFGLIPMINKADLEAEAYGVLITKATEEFKGSLDIKNIKVVLNRKELKLTHFLYHYIVTGDVIALNSNTSRAANRLDGISTEVLNAFKGSKDLTIAILDFSNINGKKSVLGRYLAEQTSNNLFRNSDLKFVERAQINKAIEEMNFGMSGFVSDASAVQIGHLVGASAVVVGTLTKVGNKISISLKIIETKTGKLLSSGTTEIEGQEYIEMYNELL
jgi:TolB-like protein